MIAQIQCEMPPSHNGTSFGHLGQNSIGFCPPLGQFLILLLVNNAVTLVNGSPVQVQPVTKEIGPTNSGLPISKGPIVAAWSASVICMFWIELS